MGILNKPSVVEKQAINNEGINKEMVLSLCYCEVPKMHSALHH